MTLLDSCQHPCPRNLLPKLSQHSPIHPFSTITAPHTSSVFVPFLASCAFHPKPLLDCVHFEGRVVTPASESRPSMPLAVSINLSGESSSKQWYEPQLTSATVRMKYMDGC